MNEYAVLLYLLAGHALADYPLQGDWLSKAKNHTLDLVPGQAIWPLALLSHSMIHALAVFLATGVMGLAVAEFVGHTIIDHAKCSGKITYNTDQVSHIVCKLAWFGVFLFIRG